MLVFPIGTDRPQRRFPWMNVLLIAANVICFAITSVLVRRPPGFAGYGGVMKEYAAYLLNPADPHLYQFISYQFLHADFSHIGFNMLFLYVFGNTLNEKLGHVGYLAFYLTGGIVAGCGQVLVSNAPTLGASGSISAVTGLFLVLLPRIHIKLFVSIFFLYMDVWEIPSMYFILLKIGQDVLEQMVTRSSNVATMAHISGAAGGIVIGVVLLATRLVQRDHYDMLSLLNRYRRRKAYEAVVASGYDPFRAGGVGPGAGGTRAVGRQGPVDPRIEALRVEIESMVRGHALPAATQRYLELRALEPRAVLTEQCQLDIANQLMADGRYPDAAAAYEDYLRVYATAVQREQIMLILGLIYTRYYPRPDRARQLFLEALPRLHDAQQREMAEAELQKLGTGAPGPPPTPPGPPASPRTA